jgi:two-component system sensor histidine kinase/response regulator
MKLSLAAQISLGIAVSIMIAFFSYETALVIGYAEQTDKSPLYGWVAVVSFMPFFFYGIVELIRKARYKFQTIDDTLSAINGSNALVEFEIDGTILSCNEIFCKVTGYSEKELIGMKHKMLMPEDTNWEKYSEFWYNLKKGKVKSGEFKRKNKANELIWIYGNYNPIKNPYGEVYRVLKIASDITDKKKIEAEVAKKNGYLEHAAKILRHDMHSGINTYIPRGLSSLKRRLSKDDISRLKITAPLKMIQEGLLHTQKVYKGVKEFTNLVKENTDLETAMLNIKDVLDNYLSSTSYGKQVKIDDLVESNINEALFSTAVDNLIRNGLKYNDSATKIVHVYMEGDNILVVEDNGVGMSQEDFEKLSEPYARGNKDETGSGLGLNICNAIIEEHGFKITSEKIETGTKIRITLK